MITDTLSNIISKDKTCLLGLAKLDKSKYLYSIAPLNKSYIYPKVISKIDNSYNETKPLEIFGEWSTEAGIYETFNCFLNDDNFDIPTNKVYSTSDWTIKTLLSLSNEADENNLNLIKINGENELESLIFENTQTKEIKEFKTKGCFIAIGQIPQNEIFKEIWNRNK